jgi:hypothetical protein
MAGVKRLTGVPPLYCPDESCMAGFGSVHMLDKHVSAKHPVEYLEWVDLNIQSYPRLTRWGLMREVDDDVWGVGIWSV